MKILHLDLKLVGSDYAEFCYYWDNPNAYQPRRLSIAEISGLIKHSETDYYTRLPEDYAKTGQKLYNWLDGSDRVLQSAINEHWRSGIVLAIAVTKKLAHLPWEVLHDGQRFLVERLPAIIPVRWVADGKQLTQEDQPKNRALNVLFMAASPLGVKPELDFEAEEGKILEATKRKPLSLTVEESGCLTELGHLVKDYEPGYFDVIHLTGHATVRDKKPCFITETEIGEPEYSSAEDIAIELRCLLPKLIFLSGCRTGYRWDEGTIPSMAETLLAQGATSVLSWGQKVLDTDASVAAATLYQKLSAGSTVLQALACTYQELIKNKARDWHIMRLYVAQTLPGALVTPLRTLKHKPAPTYSKTVEFRDPQDKLRVATRENFVGRRRQLQNCLRTLKTDEEKVGVLIHGMGGLGKSTIASRLWDRLGEHEKVFWWRQIDEASLTHKLAEKLKDATQRTALTEGQDELKYRLRALFDELNETGQPPFLLVLDDFEWNLEPRQGKYVLKPEAARVLAALVWAIKETNAYYRIIITCRYDFESELLQSFHKQPLEAFRKSDLQKKLNRLDKFSSDKIDKNLVDRALQLADGNPRLLEWLNDEVLSSDEAENKLPQLEAHPEDWKGKIIWEDLYEQIDQPITEVLSQCFVFKIPVPMPALEAVCESRSDYKEQLNRAIQLGLLEVSSETEESHRVYRVSRILPHIIPSTKLPEEPEVYSLYRKAFETLYQLWGKQENQSEEQWQEIFRLAFADRENSQRFRQGFSWMLEVQYNWASDTAYEKELRKVVSDLTIDHSFPQLEEYLQKEKWKEADEETAGIFFQVMVSNRYENWSTLLEQFPCEDLRTIDQLWVKYSNGRFGFSVQKRVFEEVGGTPGQFDDPRVWDKFGDRVSWRVNKLWQDYSVITFPKCPEGHFPRFLYLRENSNGGYVTNMKESNMGNEGEWEEGNFSSLFFSWVGVFGVWGGLFSHTKTCEL